eukprot:scaffold363_cov331-Pavlova_lutheri.AAC.84
MKERWIRERVGKRAERHWKRGWRFRRTTRSTVGRDASGFSPPRKEADHERRTRSSLRFAFQTQDTDPLDSCPRRGVAVEKEKVRAIDALDGRLAVALRTTSETLGSCRGCDDDFPIQRWRVRLTRSSLRNSEILS